MKTIQGVKSNNNYVDKEGYYKTIHITKDIHKEIKNGKTNHIFLPLFWGKKSGEYALISEEDYAGCYSNGHIHSSKQNRWTFWFKEEGIGKKENPKNGRMKCSEEGCKSTITKNGWYSIYELLFKVKLTAISVNSEIHKEGKDKYYFFDNNQNKCYIGKHSVKYINNEFRKREHEKEFIVYEISNKKELNND